MNDGKVVTLMLSEIDKVQNPAFGALLLWAFGRAYQDNLKEEAGSLLLYFLVLPICLHRTTLDAVVSTRVSSGLGKFCEKIGHEREELLAIHERCLKLRELTLNSIGFGIRAGLFSLAYDTGILRANDQRDPKVVERIKPHIKGAQKLGAWFQPLAINHVFKALVVEP